MSDCSKPRYSRKTWKGSAQKRGAPSNLLPSSSFLSTPPDFLSEDWPTLLGLFLSSASLPPLPMFPLTYEDPSSGLLPRLHCLGSGSTLAMPRSPGAQRWFCLTRSPSSFLGLPPALGALVPSAINSIPHLAPSVKDFKTIVLFIQGRNSHGMPTLRRLRLEPRGRGSTHGGIGYLALGCRGNLREVSLPPPAIPARCGRARSPRSAPRRR